MYLDVFSSSLLLCTANVIELAHQIEHLAWIWKKKAYSQVRTRKEEAQIHSVTFHLSEGSSVSQPKLQREVDTAEQRLHLGLNKKKNKRAEEAHRIEKPKPFRIWNVKS